MNETDQPAGDPPGSDSAPVPASNQPAAPRKPIAIGSQRDVANVTLAPARPAPVVRAERDRLALQQPATDKKPAVPAPVSPPPASVDEADVVKSSAPEPVSESAPPVSGPLELSAPAVDLPAPSGGGRPSLPPVADREVRSRAGLGEDIESEINAALGGLSMDEIVRGAAVEPAEPEAGERVKATVSRVDQENVLIQVKGRFGGIVPLRQFKTPPAEGDLIEVVIRSQNPEDGLFDAGLPGAAADSGDWETINRDDVVEARVTGANTGGIEVLVGNLKGFIPASQISRFRVEQLGDFVGQKFNCLVTEVNPGRRKLVLSRRAILEREFEETRKQLMATLEPGAELEGIVTRLADFGAFVDIGGVEGLVHISKLSWNRVQHPKEVVAVGQRIKVKVDKVEPDTGRIGLSHRDTTEHPWENIAARFPVNSSVKGTVTRIAQFGAFVRIDHGIEGLIHISELAHHRVFAVRNIVKEGEEVEVKILSVDAAAQKIALSLKALVAPPEKPSDRKKEEEIEGPPRELAVKPTGQPLQGGTSRPSGGEQFGLRL